MNVLNNVNITGSLYLQNNQIQNTSTILSILNVSGSTKIDNILTLPSIGSTDTYIFGNRINIGSNNSIINIIGSSTYVAVNDLYIQDKIYSLNINGSTYSGFDIGNNSGIELLGTTSVGFIKTSSDALRYQIKAPNDTNTNYILTQDSLNNLIISGTSILKNNITLNSNIFITSLSIINNISIGSMINISNNSQIDNLNIYNNFFISEKSIIKSNISINSSLSNTGKIITDFISTSSSLNISSNSILYNTSLLSELYINNNLFFNKNITINNTLNITQNGGNGNSTSINAYIIIEQFE